MPIETVSAYRYTTETLRKLKEAGFRETEEVIVLLKHVFQTNHEAIAFNESLEVVLSGYQKKFETEYLIVLLTYTPAIVPCCSLLNISDNLADSLRENISISVEANNGGFILLSQGYSQNDDLEVTLAHEYGHQHHRNQTPIWMWSRMDRIIKELHADYITAQLCGRERTLGWLRNMYTPHASDCNCEYCGRVRQRIVRLKNIEIYPPVQVSK
jgi:hypothetical protein